MESRDYFQEITCNSSILLPTVPASRKSRHVTWPLSSFVSDRPQSDTLRLPGEFSRRTGGEGGRNHHGRVGASGLVCGRKRKRPNRHVPCELRRAVHCIDGVRVLGNLEPRRASRTAGYAMYSKSLGKVKNNLLLDRLFA